MRRERGGSVARRKGIVRRLRDSAGRTYFLSGPNSGIPGGQKFLPTNPIAEGRHSFAPLPEEAQAWHPDFSWRKREYPPFPWFLRRFVEFESIADALGDFGFYRSKPADGSLGTIRRRIATELLRALGHAPFDYGAARRVLSHWVKQRSEQGALAHRGLRGDLTELGELFRAYEDPREYFTKRAPQYSEWSIRTPAGLGDTLWFFGVGAFCNSDFRRAFEECSPEELLEVFARAEGRRIYRDGRPVAAPERATPPERRPPGRPKGTLAKEPRAGSQPESVKRFLRRRAHKSPPK
jgi:hypothetical protein